MSRNMRAVRTEWAQAASVIAEGDDIERMLEAIWNKDFGSSYCEHGGDMHCAWFEDGKEMLKKIDEYPEANINQDLDIGSDDDERLRDLKIFLSNLKAMTEDWGNFLDKHGALEIWFDAY